MKSIKFIRFTLLALFVAAGVAASAYAQSFTFDLPHLPAPPVIESVYNSAITPSVPEFIVTATVFAKKQQLPQCDKPEDECGLIDWYMADDINIVPNPPDIVSVRVFYYKNEDLSNTLSADMVKTEFLGDGKWKWIGTLPVTSFSLNESDSVTYYLIAIDSEGNVTSQVPELGDTIPTCPDSPSTWSPQYATPATDNCSAMTDYNVCGVIHSGAPASCTASATVNTPQGDVCGEPSATGTQHVVDTPSVDIKGISVAADKDYFCANVTLGASPPDPSDAPPIEFYALAIFNPDMYDDNPADVWIKNAYALTFAPEVAGTDPSLIRVLWEVDCLTNPSTSNVLDCKQITVTGPDSRLQIGFNNGLKFISKRYGTGAPLPDQYSFIGRTSKAAYIKAYTGEVNLSGGTLFWFSDVSPALGFMHSNQTSAVSPDALPSGCTSASSCAVISNCADYASIIGCSPLVQVDPLTKNPLTGEFSKSPAAGVEVLLMAQDGTFIGNATTTDAAGNFRLAIDTTLSPIFASEKYKIVLHIPAADKTGVPCTYGNDSPANDCLILLKETIISDDSAVNKVAMPALPLPGGGRAEVGNANCDTAINMKDFNALKAAFNSNSGDANYKTYADFNGDGAVNMKDFNILKANFGKTFSADTSGGDPALSFLCPAE